jgi:hypothetical protein
MITNVGKNIIAKYLLGQAPSYASYIAVGCGAKPLEPYVDGELPDYSNKTDLDFEMFRVPISARGIVNDDGVSKIVLTAEIPTEERYEITEVGIYSAGYNTSLGSTDSKTLFAFTSKENWKINGSTSLITVSEPLDDPLILNVIKDVFTVNSASVALDIFQSNADNPIFFNESRYIKNETPRFLNNTIIMRGDSSTFSGSSGSLVGDGNFIQISGNSVDLSKNSLNDELRIAFSLINKDGTDLTVEPKVAVNIMVEFLCSNDLSAYSRMECRVDHSLSSNIYNFNENRYFVVNKKINELNTTNGFSWKAVDTVNIYAQVLSGTVSANEINDNYYIALDALRLENQNRLNPLYGLTGYTVIRNIDGLPITKLSNTNSYIEFRFILDVV